jgi:hypothetical protein
MLDNNNSGVASGLMSLEGLPVTDQEKMGSAENEHIIQQ